MWLPIKDFLGYEVSSSGEVRSFHRIVNGQPIILKGGRVGYPTTYRSVLLRKDNKNYYFRVHRLVAMTFYPNENHSLPVSHLDGNSLNNRIENLRFMSLSENCLLKNDHGTMYKMSGCKHKLSKLTDEKVMEIRKLRADLKLSQKKLGDMFGVSQTRIGKIINGKSWTHI